MLGIKMIEQLKKEAIKARKVMENHKHELDDSLFDKFPIGACGNTSFIFGKWLKEKGFKEVKYVVGYRKKWKSHAWLEINGLIIDITADQFEEGMEPIFIGKNRDFHDTFENQVKSEPTTRTIKEVYEIFYNLMQNT